MNLGTQTLGSIGLCAQAGRDGSLDLQEKVVCLYQRSVRSYCHACSCNSEHPAMRWEVHFITPWKSGLPAMCGGHLNPYVSVSCRLFVRRASFVSA